MLYSFLSTGFTSLLVLFVGTLFFLLLYQMVFSFLIFVSHISLLVYKNAFPFWILILYPAILQNSLIRSTSFWVEFKEFPMYTVMSSANNNSFTSFFPIRMLFISFSCLIAIVQTSRTILNKNDESRHPCLVSDLKGNILVFAHWEWH